MTLEAAVADTYLRRLVGLLGKSKGWARRGHGLWIVPSRGVHTIGMLFPIDVIFLNNKRVVVHVQEFMRPFRVSKVCLKASSVLELPPHTNESGPRPREHRKPCRGPLAWAQIVAN